MKHIYILALILWACPTLAQLTDGLLAVAKRQLRLFIHRETRPEPIINV